MNRCRIPDWIACKSYTKNVFHRYLAKVDKSRTIISNNKNHQTILLEDDASDLYEFISSFSDWVPVIALENYAKEHNLQDTLYSFLEELSTNDLLEIEGYNYDKSYRKMYFEDTSDEVIKEEKAIEDDMSKWTFDNGFLWSIFFEMTYKCNLKCIHCYNNKCDFKSQIKYEDAVKIIDDAGKLGCFNVTFSGGECTLDSDFLKIIQYAHSKRMNINVFTNGQTLHDNSEFFEEVLKCYPFRIGVSIYSADSNKHDTVTGIKGSFDKSIATLKKLRDRGVNIEVKSVQLKETVDTWKETLKLAKSFDATASIDATLTPTIDGDKYTQNHTVSDEKLMELCMDSTSPLYVGNMDIEKDYREPNLDIDGPCGAGIKTLLITPTLDLTACVSLPIKFGNLKNKSLFNIWEDAVFFKNKDSELYKWQHTVLSQFKDCFKEEYCKFCHFCPGMGLLENGKLFTRSEYLCHIAKIKMEAYKKLKNIK